MKEIILKYTRSSDPELRMLGWELLLENVDWKIIQNVIYPLSAIRFKQELQDFYLNNDDIVDISNFCTIIQVFERNTCWPISDWLMNFLKE